MIVWVWVWVRVCLRDQVILLSMQNCKCDPPTPAEFATLPTASMIIKATMLLQSPWNGLLVFRREGKVLVSLASASESCMSSLMLPNW